MHKLKIFLLKPVTQAGFLSALYIAAYFIPFSSLYRTWTGNDDYSYGLLIPFISAYFLWEKKDELKRVSIESFWPVFPFLAVFMLLSIYGILGSSGNISRPVLPVLIVLFALFCFGKSFLKKTWVPLCFLVFMVPLPEALDRTIGVYLKQISSAMGGGLLRLLGYSVHVSGNVIDLGVTKLQVVDACSGLRFVFPLMALGVVYAYFFERVAWKKALCVAITLPISVFTNVIRIGIAGVLTYQWGAKMAEGFFHDFQGWAVFMLAFGLLFIFGKILKCLWPDPIKVQPPTEQLPDRSQEGSKNSGAVSISALLLVAVTLLTLNTAALPPIKINGGIAAFPRSFASWDGRASIVDPEIIDASGAEEAFTAMYTSKERDRVSLYIGYRSTAFLENDNFFHSPTVCLPSAGWKVRTKSNHVINNVPFFGSLPVTEMVIETMGHRQLVYFWFQTKDRATRDKNINRFHLALHALKKDNTHDLFIRPITPVKKGETIDQARNRLDTFSRQMMETLVPFLKNNQYSEMKSGARI